MSQCEYEEECPKCGKDMICTDDSKDPNMNEKLCLWCGHCENLNWVSCKIDGGELMDDRISRDWRYDEWEQYCKVMNSHKTKEERMKKLPVILSYKAWLEHIVALEGL